MSDKPLLDVRGLTAEVRIQGGFVPVVNDVSFQLASDKTLAIVGESGCGKSTLALSLMRLLPERGSRVASGSVLLDGIDLATANDRTMRAARGKDIAIIFQDPFASLNPVETVGRQISEMILEHEDISPAAVRLRVLELLKLVRISDPERRLNEYPHRLSGGMCQRVMIAMALACNPKVLIADEPTTALDVTIQQQILQLLEQIQRSTHTAMLLITHNLAVVANHADDVLVMYAGRVVESGPVQAVFSRPFHPYTRGLLAATPGANAEAEAPARLREIPGTVPLPHQLPTGCAFQQRCAHRMSVCDVARPYLSEVSSGHFAACHLHAGGNGE